MLSHTARIHSIKHEALFKPFADRDALDCSPPFKLALAFSRMRKRHEHDALQEARAPRQSLLAKIWRAA